VLLPGRLFEAAFNLSWAELRRNLVAVVVLASVGVVLTTGVVALLGHAALGLAVPVAILFGAMVAPTDPVAVVAVFRKLRVTDRLLNLVEGESLLNDGTGVILFSLARRPTTLDHTHCRWAGQSSSRYWLHALALALSVSHRGGDFATVSALVTGWCWSP